MYLFSRICLQFGLHINQPSIRSSYGHTATYQAGNGTSWGFQKIGIAVMVHGSLTALGLVFKFMLNVFCFCSGYIMTKMDGILLYRL